MFFVKEMGGDNHIINKNNRKNIGLAKSGRGVMGEEREGERMLSQV